MSNIPTFEGATTRVVKGGRNIGQALERATEGLVAETGRNAGRAKPLEGEPSLPVTRGQQKKVDEVR